MAQFLALIPSVIRSDDDGQGLAEYGLILTLIAIVCVVALMFFGTQVSTMINTVGKSV
jgi:pilus assembly protein Flp/PilA